VSSKNFRAPPSVEALPGAEEEILAAWREQGVFAKSLQKAAPHGPWVFFEGPPTANNVPHVGHALTRAVKDVLPRWKTMQGYRVERKAGWDTHGLPVEISIEKELGFQDKNAIEQYGIEAFNQKCFESVRRYEREWVKASERLGFWLDYEQAYFTFTNEYVESVWQILKRMFDAGMLYEGHKVLPYCPLCGTSHSSHEVAQAYEDVKDPAITVAFRLRGGQARQNVSTREDWSYGDNTWILAWTTTPWTLPSNMALCVHPDFEYVLVPSRAHAGRNYLLARGLTSQVDELVDGKPVDLRGAEPLAVFRGADLEGLRYERLFDWTGTGTDARSNDWTVRVDPYVTLDTGSGVVHVAPAFGEDDHRVGVRDGLSLYCAMELNGRFKAHAGPYAGSWFKDADPEIAGDLKRSGNLVRSEKYEHPYPHCWRHGTPLYYFATSSWFVRTTAMKERLLANNAQIAWTPEHIRDGRFGKWLEGVVDWALSRKRYWGTPLPIWRCSDCGRLDCVGSYAELFAADRALAGGATLPAKLYDRDSWNPHRPYVDELGWGCGKDGCGGTMARVPEVIDCWFDAGSMPFAQHHWPFTEESRRLVDGEGTADGRPTGFPAAFISEAVDQTRGWFYTLHVIATFLKDSPAYRSCIVLGHVLDENGRKMSKSLGNVIAPGAIIEAFGADAFRWFFYRSNPSLPSRFGPNMVRESLKAFLIPLLNAWQFFSIYAEIDGFRPDTTARPGFAERAPLDRWVLSRLQQTVGSVTESLEAQRLHGATAALESFVDGLTNWYIRRSRRRFWKSESDTDKRAAHWTLYEVLTTVSRVLAPFLPFLAERMHRDLVRAFDAGAPESVHLCEWPAPGAEPVDTAVLARMEAAQRVVGLGHSARQQANVGVRQPLAAATVVTVSEGLLSALSDPETRAVVLDELNVRDLHFARERGAYVSYQVKPNFRVLGKRLGARMPLLQKALQSMDPAHVVAAWEKERCLDVAIPGENGVEDLVELTGDELEVRIQQKEGTVSAFDESALLALDTQLSEELLREGLAREVINRVQGLRKERDLAFDARVRLRWDGGPRLAEAMAAHGELVAAEVLAVELERRAGLDAGLREELRGETLALDLEIVAS
jgi:isoleucyl-tRNA synthetase